jgi:hypothetical protein
VYDMYRWNQPDFAADGGGRPTAPSRRNRTAGTTAAQRPRPARSGTEHPAPPVTGEPGPAAQAVQVALDRRDNGGDSGASRDQ